MTERTQSERSGEARIDPGPGSGVGSGAGLGRPVIFAALFLSGAAGLMHEIVWSKLLVKLIGASAYAQAAVLLVFMGGIALGAVVFGRRSDRRRRPLMTYVRLELAIAVYCALLPFGLHYVGAFYDSLAARMLDVPTARFLLRFALTVISVLLPAVWMGATLPILARHLVRSLGTTRREVAWLYAVNSFGAVVGVGLAGFATLGLFGIPGSVAIACALNLVAAGLVYGLARRAAPLPEAGAVIALDAPHSAGARAAADARAAQATYGPLQYRVALAALFLSGFAAMGYEVVFARVIALAFGSSAYSFTAMLLSFITGIGLGSFVVAQLRVRRPLWLFGLCQLGVAVSLCAMTPLFERLPYMIGLLRVDLLESGGSFQAYQAGKVGLSLLCLLAPTVLLGFGFPLVAQIEAHSPDKIGATVGSTYAWNTFGNMLGVVVTSLALMPALGVLGSFHVNLGLSALAGLGVLAVATEATPLRRALPLAIGGAALAVYTLIGTGWVQPINQSVDHLRMRSRAAVPGEPDASASFAAWKQRYVIRPADHPIYFFDEDELATVIGYGGPEGVSLIVNTKPDAGSYESIRTDINTQLLLAHLPLFFSAEPRDVLVIGHGSGLTAGSALRHPVASADVVEISGAVLAADRLFAERNYHVLADPRVRTWQEDGRTFLRTAGRSFDVIISEPSNPWMAGIGSLFTREFFEEARDHLKPGGVLCAWLHEYEISDESVALVLRTIGDVFPHLQVFQLLADQDLVVLASSEPLEPDFQRMEARFDTPEVRSDLARMEVLNLATLFAFHALPGGAVAAATGRGPINTDLHERLEYAAPRAVFTGEASELVWRHHVLRERAAHAEPSLLDRYATWRAAVGDPLRSDELTAVAQRVAAGVEPGSERERELLGALAQRTASAPPPPSVGEPSVARSAARGGEPALDTLTALEANVRGGAPMRDGDLARARPYFERATELDPRLLFGWANLALTLRGSGRPVEAVAELERGLAANPGDPFLTTQKGLAELEAGRPDAALRSLEAGTASWNDAQALLVLADLQVRNDRISDALDSLQRADRLDRTLWQATGSIAELLWRTGRFEEARNTLTDAISRHPERQELRMLMQQFLQATPAGR